VTAMREEFEMAIRKSAYALMDSADMLCQRGTDGDYRNLAVQAAWWGYQMGHAAGRQPAEPATPSELTPGDPLPFDQGIEAYRARVHHDNNPYQQDDWRNEEWWKGWEHEQQADRNEAFDWHADAFRQPGTEVAE